MPLDEQVAARLAPFLGLDWAAFFNDVDLAAAYEHAFAGAAGYEPPPGISVAEHAVDGPLGHFRVRTYRPDRSAARLRPILVWAHGGGFVGGSLDMREADVVSREVCARADAVVVSVDYHLAGGGIGYPTLHREVVEALAWARSEATTLGADADAVVLGGASAGANLALAATLELRAAGRPLPQALALVYPALHRQLEELPAISDGLSQLPATLRFGQASLDWMFETYAAGHEGAELASADGHDLAGLPRCLVVVSEYDDLRSSGERFAADAGGAGVDVQLHLAAGMPHGHLNMAPTVPATDRSIQRLADLVRAACGAPAR